MRGRRRGHVIIWKDGEPEVKPWHWIRDVCPKCGCQLYDKKDGTIKCCGCGRETREEES